MGRFHFGHLGQFKVKFVSFHSQGQGRIYCAKFRIASKATVAIEFILWWQITGLVLLLDGGTLCRSAGACILHQFSSAKYETLN